MQAYVRRELKPEFYSSTAREFAPLYLRMAPGTIILCRCDYKPHTYVYWKLEDHIKGGWTTRQFMQHKDLVFYFRDPTEEEQGLILLNLMLP